MYLIDSHCHLNLLNNQNIDNDIQNIFKKAEHAHVKLFLTVATSIKDYIQNIKLFKTYSNVLYSIGIHPLNSNIQDINYISKIYNTTLTSKNIIAIGEIGLDYYYTLNNKDIQKKIFIKQLQLACKLKKPVIIHTRNSEIDLLKILSSKEFQNCKGIIHSYTGNVSTARKLLNLGFYISFSGIVTFKNAYDVKESAKFIPINRILLETDSPYLTPDPYRGKKNQPSNLLIIAKYMSKLKQIDIHNLSYQTRKNFNRLFHTEF